MSISTAPPRYRWESSPQPRQVVRLILRQFNNGIYVEARRWNQSRRQHSATDETTAEFLSGPGELLGVVPAYAAHLNPADSVVQNHPELHERLAGIRSTLAGMMFSRNPTKGVCHV
jgi:hypothetical protein